MVLLERIGFVKTKAFCIDEMDCEGFWNESMPNIMTRQ